MIYAHLVLSPWYAALLACSSDFISITLIAKNWTKNAEFFSLSSLWLRQQSSLRRMGTRTQFCASSGSKYVPMYTYGCERAGNFYIYKFVFPICFRILYQTKNALFYIIPTYNRTTPYLIGIFIGYDVARRKRNQLALLPSKRYLQYSYDVIELSNLVRKS